MSEPTVFSSTLRVPTLDDQPSKAPYRFVPFLSQKGDQFDDWWIELVHPTAEYMRWKQVYRTSPTETKPVWFVDKILIEEEKSRANPKAHFTRWSYEQSILEYIRPADDTQEDTQQLLWYGPFAVEQLYLRSVEEKAEIPRAYDHAARIAHFLRSYWTSVNDHDHRLARLGYALATRVYWLALSALMTCDDLTCDMLRDSSHLRKACGIPRLSGQALQDEYHRALREWQAICMDDSYANLFIEVLLPWLKKPGQTDWQLLREEELNQTIWPVNRASNPQSSHGEDRSAWIQADTAEKQAVLRHVITAWYLPRYDLSNALAIQKALDRAEVQDGPHRIARGWKRASHRLFGIGRFAGAIGAGFLLTAFTPDMWQLLYRLSDEFGFMRIALLGFLLFAPTFAYLVFGVHQKTGIQDPMIPLRRAVRIWLTGSLFSLVLASILAWLIAPAQTTSEAVSLRVGLSVPANQLPQLVVTMSPESPGFDVGWTQHLTVVVLYALFAVAFGIFVQLLFDNRPATAPLDAP